MVKTHSQHAPHSRDSPAQPAQPDPGSAEGGLGIPVNSESVRYLLVARRYSGSPARSWGLPRATALKSRSRSKRFGSWLQG